MVNNESYHKLIDNLEKAINELQDAFKEDRSEGIQGMYNLTEYGKDLSWKKSVIIDELIKKGRMHYKINEEPF